MAQGQIKKTGGSQLVKQHKKAQNTKLSKGGKSPLRMRGYMICELFFCVDFREADL
jgi:hypothetical protein